MRAHVVPLLIACSGCSFVLVSGPGDRRPGEPVTCTRRSLVPIVENYIALAANLVAIGIGVTLLAPSQRTDVATKLEVGGGLFVVGAAAAVSSWVGFDRMTRCNRAARSYEMWLEQNELGR